MFVAYVNRETDENHLDRKVYTLFYTRFVLNLITNRMNDAEVRSLKEGYWLCETEKELTDKNGAPFRICKPMRFIGDYRIRKLLMNSWPNWR